MRASGILMPVFSLPSRYGIGSFSKSAYQFVDMLKKAGQKYWQDPSAVSNQLWRFPISVLLNLCRQSVFH